MFLFFPLTLGYLLSYLYRTVIAVRASHLGRDFGFDASTLGVLTSTCLLLNDVSAHRVKRSTSFLWAPRRSSRV